MPLHAMPALFMRGGTSNGLVFDQRDLPGDRADWDRIFLSAMGSPDPAMRQLDGMGGGLSSLSKVCIVAPPSRDDADLDYTFAQIAIDKPHVDYGGNCGNMVAAMGPAALELGLCRAQGDTVSLRIHNTNTSRIIKASFPIEDGLLAADGAFSLDGVAGTAAAIRLDFLDPGGAKTGHLLPTENPVDRLHLGDGDAIMASLVDGANPCVFVLADDLGKTGLEAPEALASDARFMARMERIRQAAAVRMGLCPDLAAAAHSQAIPKVAMVAPPGAVECLDGRALRPDEMDLNIRMLSMSQPHRALPMTGAICTALACRIKDSLPATVAGPLQDTIRLGHPSGTVPVDADVAFQNGIWTARHGTVFRTARKLFSGFVHYR